MKKTPLLLLFVMWICNISAQSSSPEVIASAGETYQGNAMRIDWTLGELSVTTIQNSSQQITQGFHQPSYTVTSVNEIPQEVGEIKVYPNPTSNKIDMKLSFEQARDVKIKLIDMNGKVFWSIEQNGNQIEQTKDLTNLTNGNYFIHFSIDENKYLEIVKIQKIN